MGRSLPQLVITDYLSLGCIMQKAPFAQSRSPCFCLQGQAPTFIFFCIMLNF
jgi:hypothetical protein